MFMFLTAKVIIYILDPCTRHARFNNVMWDDIDLNK